MAIKAVSPNDYNVALGTRQEVYNSGGWNWLKMSGLSSDIPISTTPTDLFYATGGDIYIDQVIFEVGATGLAGGTTLELIASETQGLSVFFANAVLGFGANTTLDMFTASTGQRVTIQQGTKVSIGSTSAKCTGAAVWNLIIIYRPCDDESAMLTPYATFIPNVVNPPSPV